MIEIAFLVFCAVVLGGWAIGTVVLITTYDLKTIELEKSLRRHPHARKWRGVTSLRKNLVLREHGRTASEQSVRFALKRFQSDPRTRFVEIIPRLEFPQTLRGFFAAYHEIVLAPFIKVRAAANVHPAHQHWPTLSRKIRSKNRLDRWYGAYAWLIHVTNLMLLSYIGNIGINLDQPDFLLAYMSIFGLWLAWSISNHPLLHWRQKMVYLLLAPASLGYFLWRAVGAPFAPLRKIPLFHLLRRVLS